MHLLQDRAAQQTGGAARRLAGGRCGAADRRLPKRAAEVSAGQLGDGGGGVWLETDSALKRRVEERLAEELELRARARSTWTSPRSRRCSDWTCCCCAERGVIRLGPAGRAGLIGLPRIADELYRSARVLRLFTRVSGGRFRPPRRGACAAYRAGGRGGAGRGGCCRPEAAASSHGDGFQRDGLDGAVLPAGPHLADLLHHVHAHRHLAEDCVRRRAMGWPSVMKNCEPPVFGPAFAMESTPGRRASAPGGTRP
jgi:hypothetical protein